MIAELNTTFWLGTALCNKGVLNQAQLDAAIAHFKEHQRGTLADTIEQLGLATAPEIARAIAERHGLDCIDLRPHDIDMAVAIKLSHRRALDLAAIPFRTVGSAIEIAVANPQLYSEDEARADFPAKPIRFVVSPKRDIIACIEDVHRGQVLIGSPSDLFESLIEEMVREGVSDIHLEPKPNNIRIRKRRDGILTDHRYVARDATLSLIQAAKMEANISTSERRLPGDGHFTRKQGSRQYMCRVSSIPCKWGEKVVIRIQDEQANIRPFEELGMYPDDAALCRKMFAEIGDGLVVYTGPTGSGKTTLMYSALATLDSAGLNIVTAEEPVEYPNTDYNQVSIDERISDGKHALSFASILRALVRQDPDVIMVGEIRDYETAKLSIESALTGHIVLSTLHTNTATGALDRFYGWKEKGLETPLISAALKAAIGQRLIPRVCPHCARPHPDEATIREHYGLPSAGGKILAANPSGCKHCYRGYRGRIGLFEIFRFDLGEVVDTKISPVRSDSRVAIAAVEVIRHPASTMILEGKSSSEIRAFLISRGARTLRYDGLRKVFDGITTIEAVLAEIAN